jgi:Na+-transporting NADH:ubiquinone oxidoreductase subunit NqrB
MTSAARAVAAPVGRKSLFERIDARWYSSTLLTTFLVLGQWRFQILGDSYLPWACALGTAVVTELALGRLVAHKWVNLLSAYISGNSVAILLKPSGDLLWPFVVCSFLSIASKYVLAWRGKHLWNPTNFGVCALLALSASVVSILSHQWGNELWTVAVLWVLGGITVYRAKVWHVTLTWFAAFVAFAALRAAVLDRGAFATEFAPITGPMYTMFMFFMITDPRTIVRGKGLQIAIAITIAAVECVIRLLVDWHVLGSDNPLAFAPPMFALFVVGPLALALQLWLDPPRPKTGH